MKKNLLIAALAIFGCATGFAQEAEMEQAKLYPTADTYLRKGNTGNNGGKSIIEIHSDENTDFVGLMSFNLPSKPGYDIESVTLVFYTQVVKGRDGVNIYPFGSFNEDDTYAEQETAIAEARKKTPLLENNITPAGMYNWGTMDVTAESDAEYKTIEGWKNEIDITDYIKQIGNGYAAILLTNTNSQKTSIFTKDATNDDKELEGTITNGIITDFSADAVKPYLLVKYTKNGNPVGYGDLTDDTFVRSSAADKKFGSDDNMEIFTSSDGTDFVGLMSFSLPEKEGYEVSKATLVLHSKRVKGDRKLTIYPFDYAISEGDDTWNTQKDNVAAAREKAPIISDVELNGQSGKDVGDDLSDEYKTADAWKNEFDITDYVATLDGGDVNLLLTHKGENSDNEVRIYTKEVKDVTLKDGVAVFKADDLRPKLIIEYTTATGINEVEAVEPVAKGKEGIYTLSGVRVAKADQPGIYIINGKKVLVGRK